MDQSKLKLAQGASNLVRRQNDPCFTFSFIVRRNGVLTTLRGCRIKRKWDSRVCLEPRLIIFVLFALFLSLFRWADQLPAFHKEQLTSHGGACTRIPRGGTWVCIFAVDLPFLTWAFLWLQFIIVRIMTTINFQRGLKRLLLGWVVLSD